MKKIFILFAAALMSVAAFAFEDGPTPESIPSTTEINAYKADGANVVVAFYTEAPVCNDIVWVGTVNDWTYEENAAIIFEAMEEYENWYVCSFKDESSNISGKPVQLKNDGSFAWDYQVGNKISLLSGTATISNGYGVEVIIDGLGTEAPVVLSASIWKNGATPCNETTKHEYTVTLAAPFCKDAEGNLFEPAIIGNFNEWAEGVAMTYDENSGCYTYTFTDEEGKTFKFKAIGDTDWSNQIQLYDYENKLWYDNNEITLGEETEIFIDYSWGHFTLCKDLEPTLPEATLNSKGLATFSSGKNLSIKAEGVKAYKAAVEGETITLTALEGYIPAGTGVILSGEAGTSIEFEVPAEGATAADVTGNELKATTKVNGTLVETERNSWALNGNEFLQYTAKEYQINKAYLVRGGVKAKSMNIVFSDIATGISNVNADVKDGKFLENSRIVIMKNGIKYNVMGIKF